MDQTWTQAPVKQLNFTNRSSTEDSFLIQQAVIPQLSRTERYQEKQKMWQAKFNPQDYQVTRKSSLPSKDDPTLTIRERTITFNNACIRSLDAVTHIQLLVNPLDKAIAVRGCDEWARDAIRWCIIRPEKRDSREISCNPFTTKIYKLMDWEPHIRYRMIGFRIEYEGDPVFIFELQDGEGFLKKFRDPQTGKLISPPSIQPESWNNSFGLNAADHAKDYDILANFESVSFEE